MSFNNFAEIFEHKFSYCNAGMLRILPLKTFGQKWVEVVKPVSVFALSSRLVYMQNLET